MTVIFLDSFESVVLYAGFLRGIDDCYRADFSRQGCGIAGAGNTNVTRRCYK